MRLRAEADRVRGDVALEAEEVDGVVPVVDRPPAAEPRVAALQALVDRRPRDADERDPVQPMPRHLARDHEPKAPLVHAEEVADSESIGK